MLILLKQFLDYLAKIKLYGPLDYHHGIKLYNYPSEIKLHNSDDYSCGIKPYNLSDYFLKKNTQSE